MRQSEKETLLLLANAADTPVRAVVFPGLFREGPAADKPLDLAGTYRDESGNTVEARSSLSVTVPANGFKILKKT
jgi:hypothetical protein